MGVRFPSEQQRSVAEAQQTVGSTKISAEQTIRKPDRTQTQRPPAMEQQVQDPQALGRGDQQTTIERAARSAGAETPGSIIDMLA
jgi:hypothetical protein